jgi:hypothetical protein
LIESAGSHYFDLGHIRREGAEELVEQLLKKAGLPTNVLWRVQVQKKLFCNAETPAIRVVDEPKKWAIYLRIKPGDNNTCHYCTLIMPDGFHGPEVYEQLKEAALTFDRNWKHRIAEKVPTPEPVAIAVGETDHAAGVLVNEVLSPPTSTPVIPPAPIHPSSSLEMRAVSPPPNGVNPTPVNGAIEPEKGKPSVRGTLGDRERIREVLLAMYRVNEQDGSCPQERWVELLCKRLGWEGMSRYEVGGVLTSLVRKDYIVKRVRASKPYGYELTEEGMALIADLLKAPPGLEPGAPAQPPVDPAQIIRDFGPVARQFLDAYARLEAYDKREAELVEELEMIRGEREELCRFLAEPKVKEVLAGLARVAK